MEKLYKTTILEPRSLEIVEGDKSDNNSNHNSNGLTDHMNKIRQCSKGDPYLIN